MTSSTKPKENAKSVDSIITCNFCDIQFLKKHASKHKRYCLNNDSAERSANFRHQENAKIGHPFLKDQSLFAILEILPHFPEEFKHLGNTWIRNHVIFVNPFTMDACNLRLADCVELNLNNFSTKKAQESELFIILPFSGVQNFSISLPKTAEFEEIQLKNGQELIKIDKISSFVEAKTVDLMFFDKVNKKSFYKTSEFKEFCRTFLNNAFVFENSQLKFTYFGQICELVCKNLTGDQNNEGNFAKKQENGSILNDLTSDLSILSITSANFDHSLNDSCNGNAQNDESLIENSFIVPEFNKCREKCVFKITEKTSIKITDDKNVNKKLTNVDTGIRFSNLGGLSVAKRVLSDHVITPVKFFDSLDEVVAKNWRTRSILLYGPNGCGKSSLVEALCNEAGLNLIKFDPLLDSDIDFSGRQFLENDHEKTLIFFDDFDSYLNNKKESGDKICKLVCSLIDFCHENCQNSDRLVFVLIALVAHERLDQILRRRFDVEIEISAPNLQERGQILENLLENRFSAQLSRDQIESIAEKAHGFTPADLLTLCKEAGNKAINRKFNQNFGKNSSKIDGKIEIDDLRASLITVRPSTMREIFTEVPKVYWSDIGGQEQLKLQLRQAIEWPLKHAEAFARLGVQPPTGILMYGPPGCSKTMVAKAIATESGLNFLAIKGPELFSKWVGESERAVREVFRKARQVAPSIIFFDEIDALAVERSSAGGSSGGGANVADRVLTQLLTEMDGLQALGGVLVVAATNRPDVIDRALLRPGRLDRVVHVPLPDNETRSDIFRIQFRKMPVNSDVSLDHLVDRTVGYSGAEIVAVCREAALLAMQESIESRDVAARHFDHALNVVRPRTDENRLKFYENFSKSCSFQ